MNNTKNETVRFSMKPNPLFYAFEVTRNTLLVGTTAGLVFGFPLLPALYSERGVVILLTTYAVFGLPLFIVAFATAWYLMFVVTDEKAIVRFSFWGMTADVLSIAIETVEHIEINYYGATYGSVYLNSPIRRDEAIRASILIERSSSIRSIWRSMTTWPRLLGFYGFRGFDEFANIISEQQNSVD